MGLASCGVTCLNSSLVFQNNFSAGLTVLCPENPHERQALNVVRKLRNDQTTMRISTITLLLTLPLGLFAQDKLVGRYRDYFGSRILLNSDCSFKYTWNFDMAASWTKGTWKLEGDTVFFNMVPTYDTLSYINSNNMTVDSLILSTDETPERFTNEQFAAMLLSSGGQNRMNYPDKLLFKKGRLYKIQDGKLVAKKQKGFWTNKKWDPWFFKSDD
jgi:hypothetical protein